MHSDNHSDKNIAAINNRHLDFVQTGSLISLVNDNHVDNKPKEVLVFGSIVNKLPKNYSSP